MAASKQDAAKLALEAGVDIELPDIDAYATLTAQVRAGHNSMATLDKAVTRTGGERRWRICCAR